MEIQEIERFAAVLLEMCMVEMATDNFPRQGCPDIGKEKTGYVPEKRPP